MGGGEGLKIPDYKIYKVDGIKELEWVNAKLAEKGLKDPWLRNEVWRYNPKNWPGFGGSGIRSVFRGFRWAGIAMVITIAADQALGISKSKAHHDHHEH